MFLAKWRVNRFKWKCDVLAYKSLTHRLRLLSRLMHVSLFNSVWHRIVILVCSIHKWVSMCCIVAKSHSNWLYASVTLVCLCHECKLLFLTQQRWFLNGKKVTKQPCHASLKGQFQEHTQSFTVLTSTALSWSCAAFAYVMSYCAFVRMHTLPAHSYKSLLCSFTVNVCGEI